jgi:hypothetical protein
MPAIATLRSRPGDAVFSKKGNEYDYWRMVHMLTDFIRGSARVTCSPCSPFVTGVRHFAGRRLSSCFDVA